MPSSGVQTCALDRKSTRLNSSHTIISYAVFCLKKVDAMAAVAIGFDGIALTDAPEGLAGHPTAPRSPPQGRSHDASLRPPGCSPLLFFKERGPPRALPSSPPPPFSG